MAAITLATLRQRIRNEIKDSQQTQYESFIDDAIRSAIRFYSHARLWFLEKNDQLTHASGNLSKTLPTDFHLMIGLRILVGGVWIDHDGGFTHVTWNELKNYNKDFTTTGVPSKWALFGTKFHFDVVSDADYSLDVTYIKKDVTLPSADSDTSVWFDDGQDLIRNKAMEFFYRDRLHAFDRADMHQAICDGGIVNGKPYEGLYKGLVRQHNQRQISSGLLRRGAA